ncbi:MAG TPA: hypothetical protein VND19_14715 [Acetobacteraceae bacterium]|nr:hypothetical protein [Acetobacteraceae bacterium]
MNAAGLCVMVILSVLGVLGVLVGLWQDPLVILSMIWLSGCLAGMTMGWLRGRYDTRRAAEEAREKPQA